MKKTLFVLITFLTFINIKALNLDLNSKYAYVYNDTEDKKFIPLDKHYFNWILDLSKKYGVEQVYNDFLAMCIESYQKN